MVKQGYNNKDNKQIEIRWKNLKRLYIATKKQNSKSGNKREMCIFYEELDRLLGSRPNVNTINNGIDTSRAENVSLPPNETTPLDSEELPSTSSHNTTVREKRKKSDSYSKSIEKLGQSIRQNQQLLDDAFFKKQKELLDTEFQLWDEREKQYEEKYEAQTRKLLTENTDRFLRSLTEILNPSASTNSTSSFTSIDLFPDHDYSPSPSSTPVQQIVPDPDKFSPKTSYSDLVEYSPSSISSFQQEPQEHCEYTPNPSSIKEYLSCFIVDDEQ